MQAKHGTDFVLAAQFELAQSAECLLLRRSLRLESLDLPLILSVEFFEILLLRHRAHRLCVGILSYLPPMAHFGYNF